LNASGVGRIVTVPFSFDAPDAVTIDASAVFPAIVKPEEGAGSEDTIYAESPGDLLAKLSDLRPGRPYVIEEYIPGGEPFGGEWLANYLSVESVVTHGQVRHLGMSGRLPLAPVARETGALFPVAGDERVTREIEELVERAVLAIGISVGLTHTEVKLTPDGPQIIEVNGRLGGGMSRMIPRAGLIDPVRLAVDLAVGRRIELDFGVPRRVAMLVYVQPPLDATALRGLPTPAEVRALPGVTGFDLYKRADDPVDWRQGSFGRVGDLWLEADSLDQIRECYVAVQGFLERSITYH
jgi:biotin carboxylase